MPFILINQYRQELDRIYQYGGSHNEGAVRRIMSNLLNGYCKPRNFVLVEELTITSPLKNNIRLDGIVKDALRLDWGYWEAKDEKDNLDAEIEAKFKKGYPTDNILFEDTKTAVLIQNGDESLRIDMKIDEELDNVINQFLDYERAEIKDFRQAINTFSQDLPTILDTVRNLIDSQSESNNNYIQARNKFLKVCQESINPDIKIADIREMIIQHILTEDIFTNIFSDAQFHQENNIAKQLNEVIKTFFTGNVKRNTFKTIQSYYNVIIRTASNIVNHQEKQKFLKVVYENFYKAYNPKEADRLGIVYTPNEIVKFMVQSTDYLLEKHFNKTLGNKGVEILDPCTGTGTFITEILDYLLTRDVEYKYKNEIHCNEISILPYYIANLNIEYSYQQKTGEYLEFNNICLVDTLHPTDKGEKQMSLFGMNEVNTERIKRQNEKKISVIIGNPPYNAKQENFNDNNANRKYDSIDKRIKNTYIKEGTAQNQIVVYDMYTRFIRWATDRLNDEGIITFISNSSFIDALAFDGFRKIISQEFNEIWVINTKGNARNSGERRRQEGGNIFSDLIKVGIAVYFLIKNPKKEGFKIYYHELDDYLKADDKKAFFVQNRIENINFETIKPDINNNWINLTDNNFDDLIPLIDKDVKAVKTKAIKNEKTGELENKVCDEAIFQLFSNGLKTQRDEWVYDINKENLKVKVNYLIDIYKETLKDNNYQDKDKIKWDRELSKYLDRKIEKEFNSQQIIKSNYRPFYHQFFYFDKHFNGMTYQWFNIYNSDDLDNEYNLIITISGIAHTKPFSTYIINSICDLGFIETCQCLSLYRYENGERIDNITDWALEQFRKYYQPNGVEKLSDNKENNSDNNNLENNDNNDLNNDCLENNNNNNNLDNNDNNNLNNDILHNNNLENNDNNNLNNDCLEDENNNKAKLTNKINKGKKENLKDNINNGKNITIEKEDIFNYVYGVLHNPEYRQKYELNLKREFPRIPFYDDFWQWSKWGKKLMDLHLNYETIKPYKLTRIDIPLNNPEATPKPKLKADKTNHKIIIDEVTTLEKIPSEAWEYKLGNRSALEWILDQYKEKKPKDKTIAEKFNNYKLADYKEQVIDLLMRVTTVSIETIKIINQMNK
ncbi:helicase domain protein (plasmid) [Geminocystis sp. NIES-3708]|uniref:type ISP restriction/modification enzyme n=1 Tax=Geminocystis sp. NIES-3708 TaxID=1615909 RepID=UPI0005FCDAEC|nr:type ISP restriction/modification enzyme [Geminocystis sp. NIES-3708]BAQ63226.1 helicase domain protein [Geminocystis sp. NIES-3708]